MSAVLDMWRGMTATVLPFAASVAPSGWLVCNGQAVSRDTYAVLFARIGTTYGAGNGSTTFNVPDLRGEFIRGLDAGRGVDAGRTLGSSQADALKSHTHPGVPAAGTAAQAGTASSQFSLASGGTTGATGDTETRPRNVAMQFIIKT